ncbi:hypothetical protein M2266_005967 [Streptomyces sp. SPB162]|nr:hypothetical protein [Streptomyces sp. SPB162]
MTSKPTLSIFTVPPRAVNVPLPVPAPEGGWTWPPTAATLIAGERDAILVDTVPTVEDARKLADWVEASGKELTTIYITHGHFDHFLGSSALLDRFPRARVVATEATVRLIQAEAESGHDQRLYGQMFVDKIGSTVVVPEVLTDHRLDLEGHEVIAVATGRSDVDDSSYVYVPSLSAVMGRRHRVQRRTPHSRHQRSREAAGMDPDVVPDPGPEAGNRRGRPSAPGGTGQRPSARRHDRLHPGRRPDSRREPDRSAVHRAHARCAPHPTQSHHCALQRGSTRIEVVVGGTCGQVASLRRHSRFRDFVRNSA